MKLKSTLAVRILAPVAGSRPLLFVIPVLVLIFADAVVALVGIVTAA
jgi:hypothetical protein